MLGVHFPFISSLCCSLDALSTLNLAGSVEGGVPLWVNVPRAAFCTAPGSEGTFTSCGTKSQIKNSAAQSPTPSTWFCVCMSIKGKQQGRNHLLVFVKRNLNPHLKWDNGQRGENNIFSHLIFIEHPSGKETGRRINIPTF